MTDLETIREMLKRLKARKTTVETDEVGPHPRTGEVAIEASGSAGYSGFAAAFKFNDQGELIDIGGWE